MDQFNRMYKIIKRSSDLRPCAKNYTVTNKGINNGCQGLDLISRQNSNEISGKETKDTELRLPELHRILGHRLSMSDTRASMV